MVSDDVPLDGVVDQAVRDAFDSHRHARPVFQVTIVAAGQLSLPSFRVSNRFVIGYQDPGGDVGHVPTDVADRPRLVAPGVPGVQSFARVFVGQGDVGEGCQGVVAEDFFG